VLVVDGVAERKQALAGHLSAIAAVEDVNVAADAATAMWQLHKSDVDVIFLDVELDDLDSLSFAGVLKKFAHPPRVVFVADDGRRAADAFEVAAVDFLVRPVAAERLAKSISRVGQLSAALPGAPDGASAAGSAPAAPPVRMPTGMSGLASSSVRWVEAQRDYVRVHTATGSQLINMSMSTIVNALEQTGLIRIHRSYAVQLRAITELRQVGLTYTIVVDGKELPVSRRCATRVKQRLLRHATHGKTAEQQRRQPRAQIAA